MNQRQSRYVGIWINHCQAIIVSLDDKRETITNITSDVKGHRQSSGGVIPSTPYGTQHAASESKVNRRRMQKLALFYSRVADAVKGAEVIFILGPGEAKIDLCKQLKTTKDCRRVLSIRDADKMTRRQLVAKVRKFFGAHPRQWGPRELR